MATLLKSAADTTVLIVDDTPDNLRLMAKILEAQGYTVRKALNGRMAIQGAHRNPPDVILLDINMPQMNGYEVCQELKSSPDTAHVPIIFISALDQIQDKVHAFEMGGSDYITKPFQEQEVLMRVKNQLLIQQQHQKLEQQHQQLLAQNQRLEKEIEERLKAEAEVRRLSLTDELTGLLNRRGFFLMATRQLKISRRTATPCCLLFADVDGLKRVNDTLGHAAGDRLINDTAQILQCSFREADILARFAGDEFAVLIPLCVCENRDIQDRLQENIEHFNRQHQRQYEVSISFGLIQCSLDSNVSLEQLITQADNRMYEHKKHKKIIETSPHRP